MIHHRLAIFESEGPLSMCYHPPSACSQIPTDPTLTPLPPNDHQHHFISLYIVMLHPNILMDIIQAPSAADAAAVVAAEEMTLDCMM